MDVAGTTVIHDAENIVLHDLDTDHPTVTFTQNGQKQIVDADFIAGCDGFHGSSRQAIPSSVRNEYELTYPFWLVGGSFKNAAGRRGTNLRRSRIRFCAVFVAVEAIESLLRPM